MTARSRNMVPASTDTNEVPDLTAPEWEKAISAAKVQRGRPRSDPPKVSTTIRLSEDVLEYFKAGGRGWQTRIDETLRKAMGPK